MRDLQQYGPWALVTGASDGIGKALANQIAAHGINVALVARDEARLRAVAADLETRHGIETAVLAADLADPHAVAHVETATTGLDIGLVVLAAGFGTTGTFLETTVADEMALIAVNISAVSQLSHTFAGRLAGRGKGGIILFGSIVGWQGVPGQANYAASKAYVQSLAEGLHDELEPHGVDVLSVAPGPVASGFGARAGLAMSGATAPEVAATATLTALGRRRTVIPGARGKFLTSALRPLPRRFRSLILGRVIAGMRARETADA
ncbi:MAG TPA: SDR family NAD(P)-dependent oxidoreductase [Mycobacterium sp.]